MTFTNLKYFVAIVMIALFFSFTAYAQVPTGWEITQNTMSSASITFSTAAAREGSYGMEIHVDGDYGDSVTFKLNGLDIPWSNDLEIDMKRFPDDHPLLTMRFGLWHGDTVVYSMLNSLGVDGWVTFDLNPSGWEAGTLSKIDGFSITVGYYPGFGTGPKTLMMDNFRINNAGWQNFYRAGDVGIIQGTVFNDTSGNGIRESEDGLAGITVYLSGTHIDSILTDSLGNYEFPDLPHGAYTITSPVASGWFQTKPASGSYEVTIGPDTLFYIGDFGNHATTAQAFWVNRGWNLNSVPLAVSDYSVSALYPSAITSAYAFDPNSGYQIVDTLENGPGYWIKYGDGHFIFMDGADVTSDTIQVAEGWNIVGAISTRTPVANITSDDPEMAFGYFWKYIGSYSTVDTLVANQGYWVKANKAGSIVLGNPPAGTMAFKVPINRDGEMPPPPPGGGSDGSPSTPLGVPTDLRLEQNYPNPFNPVTSITFVIPNHESGIMNHEFVSLRVYNTLGQMVATLVDGFREPGSYTVQWKAEGIPSGIYFYRLTAGRFIATSKMVLMK